MGKNTNKDMLLSITMLVSDRPDTLEKCLASMKPLLDKIPSELIIVDTAGNEKCIEISKKYTHSIIHFQWINDFAAARNTGLRKAKGKWIMFIDDDEWFEDISDIINFFSSGNYNNFETAAYITRNYSDKSGHAYNDRVAVRLSKIKPETKFIGKIHEQLEPLYEPTYYSTAYVHHYGYAFESKEELYQHSWRNIRMLTDAMAKDKDNWMAGAHLVQEYFAVSEYFSLIAVAKEMRSAKGCYDYGRIDFTTYAIVMEMQAYLELKRYEEAYAYGKKMMEESRLLLNAHLFILAMLPQLCIKCSDHKEALKYCELFWKCFQEWGENEAECKARDPFSLRERYLNEDNFNFLRMIEMHAHVVDKNWEAALKSFRSIKWYFIRSTLSDTFSDILILISNTEYEEGFAGAMEVLLKANLTKQYLMDTMKQLKGEEKWKVLYCISQIPSTDLDIMRYKMHYALSSKNTQTVEALLNQWTDLN